MKKAAVIVLGLVLVMGFFSCSNCTATGNCTAEVVSAANVAFSYSACDAITPEIDGGGGSCSVTWESTIY